MYAFNEGAIPVVDPTSADGVYSLLWLVVALPLAGAAILLVGGRYTDKWGHLLGTLLPIGSFVISLVLFADLLGRDAGDRQVSQHVFDWIQTGHLDVGMDLLYDPLSALFLLLVTGVGSLIHVYSIGYMAHDPRRRRFFGYLNLFVASMLMLVLSENYLGLFLGWEGVGLASYLLIGFWQHKPSAAAAAKKAFVINRVGDMGMSTAIMMFFVTFGSTSFTVISANAAGASETKLTILGFLLLLGACAKSAQFPLQAWLLDAMEGPTPVSALIHAATMVTAGVYLIVRSNFVFELAPDAQTAVVVIALISILWGAAIGCAKDDIKKGLAGSTMSQIGYMMLGAGLGAAGYAFAIFHLLTHGFFKANMFLGAGSVMHAMNDRIDMRRFGGLSVMMRITWVTFGLGWLSIIGFPFLSGFYSKDQIIEAAFIGEGWRPWLFGGAALLGAGITAFYMTRLFAMTFHGERRWDDDVHPHESPLVMTVPMMVLAVGSAFLGLILGPTGWITSWLEPVTGSHGEGEPVLSVPVIIGTTLVLVAVGAGLAWTTYAARAVPRTAPAAGWLTVAARRDLYQDAFNEATFMRPGQYLTRSLVFLDNRGVDGLVNGLAALVGGTSGRLRRLQTGFVRSYALSMFTGAALVVATLLLVRL